MKEAIGGISLFQIVILFILLFTGIMCLTINHSKAFGVKDEIINIVEAEVLASNKSKEFETKKDSIIAYFNEVGYRITGKCPNEDGWEGYDRNGASNNDKAVFCIRSVDVEDAYRQDLLEKCKNGKCTVTYDDFPEMIYYDVIVFYQLDIPIVNEILTLKLQGSTKTLMR